jgi:hypothetical protein
MKIMIEKVDPSQRNDARNPDPGDPVDDEDWRDRPRTDPSSVSDLELAKDLRPQTNWFQLDFLV